MKTLKSTIILLLFSVALVIIIIMCKPWVSERIMGNANYCMASLIKSEKIDNLFIGSSMFRQGIEFSEIEKDSVWMLAYNGIQPIMISHILEYLLENVVEIDTLYCDMYVYTIIATPSISDDRIFLDTSNKFKWSVLSEAVDEGGDYSSMYDGMVHANNEFLLTFPISYPLINARYDRGSSLHSDATGLSKDEISKLDFPADFGEFNDKQVEGLKRIFELTREYGIDLVFIETPKYIRIAQNEQYLQLMYDYCRLVSKNADRIILSRDTYSYVVSKGMDPAMIGCVDFNNDNSLFYLDLIHLSGQGRYEYSKSLFDYLHLN